MVVVVVVAMTMTVAATAATVGVSALELPVFQDRVKKEFRHVVGGLRVQVLGIHYGLVGRGVSLRVLRSYCCCFGCDEGVHQVSESHDVVRHVLVDVFLLQNRVDAGPEPSKLAGVCQCIGHRLVDRCRSRVNLSLVTAVGQIFPGRLQGDLGLGNLKGAENVAGENVGVLSPIGLAVEDGQVGSEVLLVVKQTPSRLAEESAPENRMLYSEARVQDMIAPQEAHVDIRLRKLVVVEVAQAVSGLLAVSVLDRASSPMLDDGTALLTGLDVDFLLTGLDVDALLRNFLANQVRRLSVRGNETGRAQELLGSVFRLKSRHFS